MEGIRDLWNDEGFIVGPDNGINDWRESLYQSYLDGVNWTDNAEVVRAVRVFHHTARSAPDAATAEPLKFLERDGYTFDDDGEPIHRSVAIPWRAELLNNLDSSALIHEHLDRMSRAIDSDDPPQVIGAAKELIESTAKLILNTRGISYLTSKGKEPDIPQLVKRAQEALGVHPSAINEGADGQSSTIRILGGLATVALGLGELRNAGYGTGHGPGQERIGLYPRHAHLALSASRTWCEFMLDTLRDSSAPWRKTD